MKRILLIPLLSTMLCAGGFERDKQLHFAAGALVGGITTEVCIRYEVKHPRFWGFVAATAVGLLKEMHDRNQPGNRFDKADLAWTMGGGAVGVTVTYSWRF